MLSTESNIVVCSPFVQQATPGTQKKSCKKCFERGGELKFFWQKCEVQTKCYRINTILSFAPPFFKRLSPGHGKRPVKNVLKGEGGELKFFWQKCEVQTKCYRINTILSFAPPFFKRLPPGHRKKPVKIVFKGGLGFFL